MRLINKTSYPTDEMRKLMRWATRDLNGMKGVRVEVIPARKWCSGLANWRRRYIIIRLAPPSRFPFVGWHRHRNSPLNHDWQTWQEALVAIAAHEGRHMHNDHWNHNKGKNGKAGEMNCEAYEHAKLQEYRRGLAEGSVGPQERP